LIVPPLGSTYYVITGYDMESKKKNTHKFRPNPSLNLMNQVREVLRYHHYAYRTEQTHAAKDQVLINPG
jgi:hypothetical protein